MIKCIACDLDGTLIKKDDTIEETTYQLLKECMNNGVELILATGRDINMVIDFMANYHLDCDLVLNNGTQYRNLSGSFNEVYPMEDDAFIKMATILQDYGYLLAIHTTKGKYSLHDTEEFWDYHMKLLTKNFDSPLPKKTFTTREGYLRDFHYVPTPKDVLLDGAKVLKVDARHLDAYSIQGVKDQLNIEGLDISSSFEDNIEITSNKSNKGTLLKQVIKQKGYQEDEVAVFGDGLNDCAMLEAFNYSFAPSNAGKYAKQAANYVLEKSCDEGAVGEAILFLKEKELL